jgi:hypothetical protein
MKTRRVNTNESKQHRSC